MPASVLGLDIGGSSATVAKVENGGVVIINNELSQRSTPTLLSLPYKRFGSRLAGASAAPHLVSHPGNTVSELRNLLGAKNLKPEYIRRLKDAGKINYNGGSGGISVNYQGRDQVWQPEQLVAAYLTHLVQMVVDPAVPEEDKKSESYYTLSVPHYFTDQERTALLNASAIAKMNNVNIINDLSAAALAYGYFQKGLPENEKSPKKVAFVDFGYSGIQSAMVEFTAGGLKVVNVQFDRTAGGQDLDWVLAKKFADEFVGKNPKFDDVYNNKKAMTKLLKEAEKVKRQMSANKNKIPVNVECLIDGIDYNGSISRDEFERLSHDVFVKVESCLRRLLLDSGYKTSDIQSVEVIGGSSRVPMFKTIIQKVFGKPPSTTLNADEAVSKGAALYCASVSKVYSVRQFYIQDISTTLSIRMKHAVVKKSETPSGEDDDTMTVATDVVETSKTHRIFGDNEGKFEATVYLKERPDGDTIALEYDGGSVLSQSLIAIYQLDGLPELSEGEKIALSFRIWRSQPYLFSAKIVNPTDGDRPVNFTESRVGGLVKTELAKFVDLESTMIGEDEQEQKRQEIKNNFEGSIFRSRDELNNLETKYAKEEAWQVTMDHVRNFQDSIASDDSYEDWTFEQFEARLVELKRKMDVFHMWQRKYEQYLQQQSRKRRVRGDFDDIFPVVDEDSSLRMVRQRSPRISSSTEESELSDVDLWKRFFTDCSPFHIHPNIHSRRLLSQSRGCSHRDSPFRPYSYHFLY